MSNDTKILTKPEELAQIIYEAVVRYTKAKESQIREKMTDSKLDFYPIQRGNSTHKVDLLENINVARRRK